jgi:hypothetical protein
VETVLFNRGKVRRKTVVFSKASKVRRFIKVALYGDKKSGKSKAALSFPEPSVADAERGTLLYADEFNFGVRDANRWQELMDILTWLEKNDHPYKSFVVDSLTVFWQDLVEVQTQYALNRRNSEILTQGDWGIIKRRWKGFLNRLIDLDMNVVLVMREKDEYENYQDPRTGEDKNRKTGEKMADAEKSTGYVFDFILRLYTVEDKKKKASRHFATVEGTRHKKLPKYSTFDITDKKLYDVLFTALEKDLLSGAAAPKREIPKEPATGSEKEPEASSEPIGKPSGATEHVGAMLQRWTALGTPANGESKATPEDLKVLMTRANQLAWPSGEKFKSADGKDMIKALFKVESTKDLTKPQVDFIYEEFGRVLSETAVLARDEKGIPFVATKSVVDTEAVKAATEAEA